MKSVRCLIFFLFVFVPLHASAEDTLRVVYFQYPPNLVVNGLGAAPGEPRGAIVKVWENYIAPKAGVRIVWIGPVPFSRAMKMLEEGSADAIQHLSRTPEREAKFIFSRKPIMWGRSGLLVLKSESLSGVTGIENMQDKKIAIIGEGYLPPFIVKNRRTLNIEEVYGDEAGERIVKMVVNRRIWAGYFTFPDVLLYYAASNGMKDKLKVISYPGSEIMEVTYAAMSRKADPSLAARIDAAVSAVYGSYDYPALVRDILRQVNR